MEQIKLFDSELKLMKILWNNGQTSAKDVSSSAAELYGWNKNTTYTVLNKLVAKGAVGRTEPNFMCRALVESEDVGKLETESLIKKLYGGSKKAFFAAFLEDEDMSAEELEELRRIIDDSPRLKGKE